MMDYDVVIVGGGPAGLTAGIYCVRRRLKAVVVERGALGGQMNSTPEIANWPGDRLVSGPDLSKRMAEHAKSLGLETLFDDVVGLEPNGKPKTIYLRQRQLTCSAVIIATGGQHRKAAIKGQEEFEGKGVSYCATCDGPFFKGKSVAVIGSGNMAAEDALYLSELAGKTYLLAKALSAEDALQSKLKKSKVEWVKEKAAEISGSDKVASLKLESGKTLAVDGIFFSEGHTPSSELAKAAGVELDERGFIKINRSMETNIPGVYAAGDITGGIPQIATAVGEGCTAALKAYGYVKNP
ncbi:MAG: FAD-dependent oxidoreductase [Candidatus Altiarchaeota archaeon]